MKRLVLLCFFAGALLPLTAGCGDGSTPSAVAEQDELAAYLAENPDSGADLEGTGGDDEE